MNYRLFEYTVNDGRSPEQWLVEIRADGTWRDTLCKHYGKWTDSQARGWGVLNWQEDDVRDVYTDTEWRELVPGEEVLAEMFLLKL